MSVNTFRQSLQSTVRLRSTQLSLPKHKFQRSFGGFSHFWSNTHISFHDDREQRQHNAIPRISLLPEQQRSLTLPTRRFHSTSRAGEESLSASANSDKLGNSKGGENKELSKNDSKKGHPSFKEMFTKYGSVFVGTYLSVYVTTLGLIFAGVESGVLDPAYAMSWVSQVDDPKSAVQYVTEMMEKYSWTRDYAPMMAAHPSLANFGFSWIMVKFTEPVRFGVTMAVLPAVIRYTGAKPVTDTPENEKESKGEEKAAPDASSLEGEETKKR